MEDMKSAKIFTPIQIGNRTFRNRIMMAPMTLSIESMDGTVSEELQKHYVERAEGGVGILEGLGLCAVLPAHGGLDLRILWHPPDPGKKGTYNVENRMKTKSCGGARSA